MGAEQQGKKRMLQAPRTSAVQWLGKGSIREWRTPESQVFQGAEAGGIDVASHRAPATDEVLAANAEARSTDACPPVCSRDGGENARLRHPRTLRHMHAEHPGAAGEVSFSSDSNCGSNRNRSSKQKAHHVILP
jgi:hypothetical protein